MKQIGDGSLVYSVGEVIPTKIAGYRQDPLNRNIFKPILSPCEYRVSLGFVGLACCGRVAERMRCEKKRGQVNVQVCERCRK